VSAKTIVLWHVEKFCWPFLIFSTSQLLRHPAFDFCSSGAVWIIDISGGSRFVLLMSDHPFVADGSLLRRGFVGCVVHPNMPESQEKDTVTLKDFGIKPLFLFISVRLKVFPINFKSIETFSKINTTGICIVIYFDRNKERDTRM
jgi:hypothetical protein